MVDLRSQMLLQLLLDKIQVLFVIFEHEKHSKHILCVRADDCNKVSNLYFRGLLLQWNHSGIPFIAMQLITPCIGQLRRYIERLRRFQAAYCHSFRIRTHVLSLSCLFFSMPTSLVLPFYCSIISSGSCFSFSNPASDTTSENNDV